jgi:hypothetical protein
MGISDYTLFSPLFALADTFVLTTPDWLILAAAGLAVTMFGEGVRRARAKQRRWKRRISRGSRVIQPSSVRLAANLGQPQPAAGRTGRSSTPLVVRPRATEPRTFVPGSAGTNSSLKQ